MKVRNDYVDDYIRGQIAKICQINTGNTLERIYALWHTVQTRNGIFQTFNFFRNEEFEIPIYNQNVGSQLPIDFYTTIQYLMRKKNILALCPVSYFQKKKMYR